MRFVIIMCGGRSGSDLQNLFDSLESNSISRNFKIYRDFLKIFSKLT